MSILFKDRFSYLDVSGITLTVQLFVSGRYLLGLLFLVIGSIVSAYMGEGVE